MLRNKPKVKYCGLTVILSNPSRFDKLSLLTANGGTFFNNECLQPDYNQMQCDVRLMEDKSPFIDGTKCVLLLGEAAMHAWCPDTGYNTLNEMRGSPLYIGSMPAMASFNAQDCADIKAYEQSLNKEAKDYTGEDDSEEDSEGDQKAHSGTRHSNFAFWLKSDVRKCKELLKVCSTKWPTEPEPVYKIYPPAEEVINVLESNKEGTLYFDIETDYEEQNLLCFALSFDLKTIYSVPILNYEYKLSYTDWPFIIRSLVGSIKSNTLIAHNGAGFDFFVLAYKYHIPIYKVYDTMIAMHRCFPDIEVSLGHCISYWTHQRFHKDTDSKAYLTQGHMMAKLKYCAKDVFTLGLIHRAIEKYASTIPGLPESIRCANDSIRPYLITTLQGIRYDEKIRQKLIQENDELMMQYLRIINILIGEKGLAECKKAVKGKAKAFPGSNTQCCNYFHEQLGYAVQMRSEKTGKPSLGKTLMYKLMLKYNNPVILFTNLYRGAQKELGALMFNPWKGDDGKVLPRRKVEINEE